MSEEETISPGASVVETATEVVETTEQDEQENFRADLYKVGISDRREAEKYNTLLDAEKAVVVVEKTTTYDGQTKDKTTTEKATVVMVPDVVTQLQALKLLGQARQRFEKKQRTARMGNFMAKVFVQVNNAPASQKSEQTLLPGQVVDITPSNPAIGTPEAYENKQESKPSV